MKSPRKYVRIALSEDDMVLFEKVKLQAEQSTGIALSDSNFALSVIRQALKERSR